MTTIPPPPGPQNRDWFGWAIALDKAVRTAVQPGDLPGEVDIDAIVEIVAADPAVQAAAVTAIEVALTDSDSVIFGRLLELFTIWAGDTNPSPTFFLTTEAGNALTTEAGDALVTT